VFNNVEGNKMNSLEQLNNLKNLEKKEADASVLMIGLLVIIFLFIFVLSGVSLLMCSP
jgi:hypothetical protein